ncbi:MAG: HAD-IIA family hydrolase [Alphaproteobacteria bacterium]
MASDADWAFAQYEKVRGSLPTAAFPVRSTQIANIGEVADQIDVFLLDAFGVLNVGETVIAGAPERVAALQAAGKQVFVVTNGASLPPEVSLAKYRKFGFDFQQSDVIASRDALSVGLTGRKEKLWGVMALEQSKLQDFPVPCVRLGSDPALYDQVEGFILLGSAAWSEFHQDMLISALKRNPRPVMVGNPDIVAPRETGLTLEPGWYAHDLAHRTGIAPEFYGKPFTNVYDLALAQVDPSIPRDRIAMVGDTLHTDVLGGAAIGVKTILITDYGLFAGKEVAGYINDCGIVPDWISKHT